MELHLDEYVGIRGQSTVQQALSNRTLVTEMAADWAKASACAEKVLDLSRCQGTGDRFGPIILFSGFINSPGAIDKIVAVSGSQCLTEENALDEAIEVLQQCVTTFDQAVSEKPDGLCASFDQLWQCMEESGSQLCGAVAGNLIGSLKEFAGSSPRGLRTLAAIVGASEMDFTPCEQK